MTLIPDGAMMWATGRVVRRRTKRGFSMFRIVLPIAALAAAFLHSPLPAVAQGSVTGTYQVDGTNPNGSKYSGVAVVEATGQTYLITWTVGGSKSVGRGVFLDKTLAVGGVLGNGGFVFAMSPKNGNLEGVWADMQRGTTLGAEVWTRVK